MGNPIPVHLEQECRKATKILNEFVDPVNGLDKIVPLSVLRKARGFAIFSVFRIGFLLSARAGSGVVVARLDDGRWSAPAAIGIGGLGGGFNAGAEVTDFLIVLNSKSAVRSFMATGSLQLGGNLSVAVGPLGRSAEASGSVNTKGRVAAMFSYSKSKGLYGGISVEGTILVNREDANVKAYGHYGKNPKQILSGNIERPQWASGLIQTIDRFTLVNTPSKDLDGEYFNYDDTSSFDQRGLSGSGGRRDSFDSIDSRDLQEFSGGRKSSRNANAADDLPDHFDQFSLSDTDRNRDRDRQRDSFDDWEGRDRRRKEDDYDNRNFGSYAFGSPSSSLSNTPARVGSAASQSKRPGIRQRSSSIASNLSFSSFGRKKLDRSGPTPPPDWDDIPGQSKDTSAWGKHNHDGMDGLDRELQSSALPSLSASRKSSGHSKSYSVAGGVSAYNSGGAPDGRVRSGSVGGRGSSNTPVGWSQFSANDDAQDNLFGDGSVATRDPFDDLDTGVEPGYTGVSNGSYHSGYANRTAPPPSKIGSRFGKFRTPSPGSSAFSRKKTPTIAEDDGDQYASLISTDIHQTNGNGNGVGRRESFSLSNENASVPVLERVIALYDFEAQEEGDLGFTKGQVIAVTKKTDSRDDWWQGRVEAGMSASKVGIFPCNYTAPL
ncbi:related to YSC84 - protein involved in the organization of actin cytoskeleton [Melanopsichium pennsylvanicum]|uniref:Related to YSC84 - protein involved in the organization of actin cytoskeleton n=2 Tax=Melanopsichium pennsylvanicum TaxID=63383 RepID=A0AAJ5C420_9BASI|nr:related to YSC84-protein involved in the organization of actin cytoskeleton [Melanopsichium pennsylvanicum 4]SNX83220.1 related to YSC84 - protein involved in the organization of actin cytoskeleton [Melanopsichium pennsylvanicum]